MKIIISMYFKEIKYSPIEIFMTTSLRGDQLADA